MKLERKEIIKLIYGEGVTRRFTQDSPVLPDVWIAYAEDPLRSQDLLLTPYQHVRAEDRAPGALSKAVRRRLEEMEGTAPSAPASPGSKASREIAYNQSIVAAKLSFAELIRVVLPMSEWWSTYVERGFQISALGEAGVRDNVAQLLAGPPTEGLPTLSPDLLWTIRVVGTIALAGETADHNGATVWPPPPRNHPGEGSTYFRRIVDAVERLLRGVSAPKKGEPHVHLVTLNRPAKATLWRSTAAVKADAAARVFDMCCKDITWAVVDCGIDASHPAFLTPRPDGADGTRPVGAADGNSDWMTRTRVLRTYDFTIVRKLLSTDADAAEQLPPAAKRRLKNKPEVLKTLRASLNSGREIDWALLEPFILVCHDASYPVPKNDHGTHVAGILGADWRPGGPGSPIEQPLRGMCPDINLFDLRVLDDDGQGDEFSVMAALQFIRHLNEHSEFIVVHGVNLSLSIRHDVMNYACGRTPVCDECSRLVGRGIVVVAAAGNEGYRMRTPLNDMEGYQAVTITDPGNAESIITVGATHRDSPHTYGVSYFSSRGPTGDGRAKPDLVAPGEKIESCVPGEKIKRMDGTSMAAPHVSGAAAMLMARHNELIGDPARIKSVLCDSATDLGREKYFQGRGMLDILRALQSI